MRQSIFHVLMVCLFLPVLVAIANSLNNYGFPLMEQYQDIKFFVALPYLLLVAASLYGCSRVADRLSWFLAGKFGKPEEKVEYFDQKWAEKYLDENAIAKNEPVFRKKADAWLKENIMAKIIFGLIIGAVLAM
jgi:Na+/H+-dicarboxylate symporter